MPTVATPPQRTLQRIICNTYRKPFVKWRGRNNVSNTPNVCAMDCD